MTQIGERSEILNTITIIVSHPISGRFECEKSIIPPHYQITLMGPIAAEIGLIGLLRIEVKCLILALLSLFLNVILAVRCGSVTPGQCVPIIYVRREAHSEHCFV
jgi:hypothetical protein